MLSMLSEEEQKGAEMTLPPAMQCCASVWRMGWCSVWLLPQLLVGSGLHQLGSCFLASSHICAPAQLQRKAREEEEQESQLYASEKRLSLPKFCPHSHPGIKSRSTEVLHQHLKAAGRMQRSHRAQPACSRGAQTAKDIL